MDWLFRPLATSSYLVAIANVVALGTAAYFGTRFAIWIVRLISSIYNNRVKEFLKNQRGRSERLADICSKSASFFIAHVVSRGMIIVLGVLAIIVNIISLQAKIAEIRTRAPIEGQPFWISGESSYNAVSLATLMMVIIVFVYMWSLVSISLLVRRKVFRSLRKVEDQQK